MKRENFVYITIIATLFIVTASTFLESMESQARDDSDQHKNGNEHDRATAQITNSKYLTISGVNFNQNDNTINIMGMITNNSTRQSFTNVLIVGELYDKENRLITATSGSAASANLPPGQQSAFTINTNLPSHEEIVRYALAPGGFATK